jgi:hypothetical protein
MAAGLRRQPRRALMAEALRNRGRYAAVVTIPAAFLV